ncbi:MAG: hypothetical protein AVDCRST_MAG67-1294 [uncultured Solirubrobacteraceae bacterium]|uniref:Uncharacterized protein n=1 Tax=uncultured Solirubrobacteraceae bacterium TaxID=1162706 RepID=A0A6J4S5A5_9ACTN|nr:MAG: hypothetical protein AVDCRST_MAG67-1294 [uncultured Solirubrobacteraceae bacterium]
MYYGDFRDDLHGQQHVHAAARRHARRARQVLVAAGARTAHQRRSQRRLAGGH